MNIEDLIHTRRTIYQFTSDQIVLADILPALSAATMAPNHHLSQPWKFCWIGEHTRLSLADIYAKDRATKQWNKNNQENINLLIDKAKKRFMAVPAIVYLLSRVEESQIETEENFAACCCAMQNFLLSLHGLGLGAQWSTPPMIYRDEVKEILGLPSEQWRTVGMVYIGKPAVIPPNPPRKNFMECLTLLS